MTVIPPITDPLGRSWRQPPLERILLDDSHAVMDTATFQALLEYSTTLPTGVYPGKMWRAQGFDARTRRWTGSWFLRWFGECDDPAKCSNNQREILLA